MRKKSDINSSVYVATRISNSPQFLIKLLWLLILITCLICSTYRIQEFYYLYQQYPAVVSLRLDQKYNLQFPAVTVCNLNRRNIAKRYLVPLKPHGPKSQTLPIGTPILLTERSSLISCQKIVNGTNDRESRIGFLKRHYAMDKNEISKLGHNISEMLEECSMNRKSCSALHLNQFVSFR
ncbi:acid-sensing ion channel 4, partial [Nephila pilipes]